LLARSFRRASRRIRARDNGDDPGAAFIAADSGGSNEGGRQIDDNGPAQVPEPASVLLFGPAALFALRRRNRVN
jgi:hypothetical protein